MQVSYSGTLRLGPSLEYCDSIDLNSIEPTLRNVGSSKMMLSDFFIEENQNITALTFGVGCNMPSSIVNVFEFQISFNSRIRKLLLSFGLS